MNLCKVIPRLTGINISWNLALASILVLSSFQLVFASDPQLSRNKLNSSIECAKCHSEIYDKWRRSLHSMSVTDPIFDTSYALAYRETAGEAKHLCLKCHAPAAVLSGDLELRESVSVEGVTCDYCHSVTDVDLNQRNPEMKVSLDGIKRGPLADSVSSAHEVAQSSLHSESRFCAGCHEYANEDGLLILSTFSEWRISPQAKEGKTCQSCHMPLSEGTSAVAGKGTSRRTINLHNISGGHSTEQVRKAARVKILKLEKKRPTLARVEVEVKNTGSGHYIPTGIPTRQLVLEVDVMLGTRKIQTLKRRYQRVLSDDKGRVLTRDFEAFLPGVRLVSDNRIRAGEARVESFVLEIPDVDDPLRASVRLRYLYQPLLMTSTQMSILMSSDESR